MSFQYPQLFELGVPDGCILMWSGAIDAIPVGWLLCDGQNGTPDLRDRFIVGAADTYKVGDTGGADSVALSVAQLASHEHAFSGTAASAGAHVHSMRNVWPAQTFTNALNIVENQPAQPTLGVRFFADTTYSTDASGAHTHGVSGTTGNAGSSEYHENRPPYYALYYIMKIDIAAQLTPMYAEDFG